MSFGRFLDNSTGGGFGGARMVADIPYSNNMATGATAIAQPRLMSPSLPKNIFNSPGLSLALVMMTAMLSLLINEKLSSFLLFS